MKLRVGLVGLGSAWETRHRPALRALSDRFDVRAICAEIAQRAEAACREFDAAPVDGFRALMRREDIDAILMLSPDWCGTLPMLAGCEAGKAVYCSIALDIEHSQARELKERVDASGAAFMAEFPRRHAPATLRLKELIATRLGQPRLLFCHERLFADNSEENSFKRPNSPAMREMMELVDWCRYVVGSDPATVIGVKHSPNAHDGREDYQMLSLDFSPARSPGTGATAQISCGYYVPKTWREAISFRPPAALQVCCERGVAFVDLPSQLVWFDGVGQHHESLDSERPVGEHLLTQFHRAVTSLVRKTSDLDDAYRALTIVLAAKQSFTEGRRIELQY